MPQDFIANQVRTSQIIASGSTLNSSLAIYGGEAAADYIGGTTLPSDFGTDTFLFVSGSKGSVNIPDSHGASVFGGDVFVSGNFEAQGDVLLGSFTPSPTGIKFLGRIDTDIVPSIDKFFKIGEAINKWLDVISITGSLDYLSVANRGVFAAQLSGSLQQTAGGLNYLLAGAGIDISTSSLDQVTITSLGTAGGIDKQVQFNDGGFLAGDDGLVYDKSTKTLSVENLYVTGSITAISSTNLTITDPIIYLASGTIGPDAKSVIAFSSGSAFTDESLIFGSAGGDDVLAAARLDVQDGNISQSSLDFTNLVPIRASKFEIGGTFAAITSSDGQDVTIYSGGGAKISVVPGSTGLILGNSSAEIAASGSAIRFGSNSVEFGGEIPPHPGADSYFFVSGAIGSKDTSYAGVAIFGGDVVISGTLHGGSPLKVSGSIASSGSLRMQTQDTAPGVDSNEAVLYVLDDSGTKKLFLKNSDGVQKEVGAGAGGSPGGSDTNIQYNSGGSFAGSNDFTFDGASVYLTGSLSQGANNVASGLASHAEGYNTTASGQESHAEGYYTLAEANYSHAEGSLTIATGDYSHVEGLGTISSGSYQHVAGKYNTRGDDYSLFVIGNGTSDDDANRSDVLRVLSGTIGSGFVQVTGSLAMTEDLTVSGSAHLGESGTDLVYFNGNLATSIIPNVDVSLNLGSENYRFANVYTGDLHLRNERGDYTLIEEEDCLTIRFNKTGKRYKFVLEPAPEYED